MQEEIEALGNIYETAGTFLVTYSFQILGAIIILLIGWWLANRLGDLILRVCSRHRLDITLLKFFANVARILVLVFVVILALNKFGISIAPFVAAVGATLALQGSLSGLGAHRRAARLWSATRYVSRASAVRSRKSGSVIPS